MLFKYIIIKIFSFSIKILLILPKKKTKILKSLKNITWYLK